MWPRHISLKNHWFCFTVTVRDFKPPDSPIFHSPLLSPVEQACTFFFQQPFGTVFCEGKISLHVLQKYSYPNNFLLKLVGSLSWLLTSFSLGFFFQFKLCTLHSLFSILILEWLHSVSNLICSRNGPIFSTWKERVWRKNSMGNGIPKNQQKELTEVTNYTSILILEK